MVRSKLEKPEIVGNEKRTKSASSTQTPEAKPVQQHGGPGAPTGERGPGRPPRPGPRPQPCPHPRQEPGAQSAWPVVSEAWTQHPPPHSCPTQPSTWPVLTRSLFG